MLCPTFLSSFVPTADSCTATERCAALQRQIGRLLAFENAAKH